MSLLMAFLIFLNINIMKKNVKVASNPKEKEIVKDAFNSFENEQLDLYKAVFGGLLRDCSVVAVARPGSAYDKFDPFLKARA